VSITETKSLPAGWQWVKLKDIGIFDAGGTPAKDRTEYWGGKTPFVTGADITDLRITKDNARAFLSSEGLYSGKTAICQKGTILIVTRTRVGRVGIAQETMGASQDITAFKCKPSIDQEFICRYLNRVSNLLIDNCRGATIQGLTRDFIDNIEIPLPPLPEQKRIAAILKDQMAAVDKARAAAQARLEAVKSLPAAFLRQIFPKPGQALTAGWRWVKLGGVCEFLDYLRIPVSEAERAKRNDGKKLSELYPYYGANGQAGWIDDYLFNETLILLAEDGGAFGSANTSIAYKIEGKTWVNNHAHVLRPLEGIDLDFCLASISIRPDLAHIVTGNTRPKLNQALASNIPVPLPPLTEQKRIAAILRDQMATVNKARVAAEAELETINALPAALLRRAFSGEL